MCVHCHGIWKILYSPPIWQGLEKTTKMGTFLGCSTLCSASVKINRAGARVAFCSWIHGSLIRRDPSQGQELGGISWPGLQSPLWSSLTPVFTRPPASQQHCLPGNLTKWDFSCSCCKSPWLRASGLELTAAFQGKAPRLTVAECGHTRGIVSLFAQMALAQVAWPVLAPLRASSAYNVLPHPLACSPVMSPWCL